MQLRIMNCTKKYSDLIALNNCSFTLESGIYALLGPNGSGKSTLMNLISTLIYPTEGDILWNGKSIYQNKEYLKNIGYMPQYPCLYEEFSLYEYLNYMGNIKGIKKANLTEQIPQICKDLQLYSVMNQKLASYSGGMKQRAMLAQALIGNPKILILDEPTAGLDPLKRIEIQNLISKLSQDKIIIFATHVVSDVEFIAKEFLLLKKGELIHKSSREQLCKLLEGHVHERNVDSELYQTLNSLHQVSSIRFHDNQLIARVISDKKVDQALYPSLIDVYLYIFHEELDNE